MAHWQSAFGFCCILLIAWAVGENRRHIAWRIVISGIVLQAVLGLVLLKVPATQQLFLLLNEGLQALERATQAGTAFVFGFLGGATQPYTESGAGSTFVLAFRALPIILVISALSTEVSSVGAGGGSLVAISDSGDITVGPASAGAALRIIEAYIALRYRPAASRADTPTLAQLKQWIAEFHAQPLNTGNRPPVGP